MSVSANWRLVTRLLGLLILGGMRKSEIGEHLPKALRRDKRTSGMPMRPGSEQKMFRAIGRLFRTGTAAGWSDAQLLERFLQRHDEAAEAAFAALVERHGPMVLAVCRRVLNNPHDAQDAFQATFLVLVRKAGAIRKRGSIADWLHGVALRVSAHARADSTRRRSVERRAGMGSSIVYETIPSDRDVWDEVEHLPQDLRAVVMLCYLEGLTHEQAARQLGWPVGTVRSRLARARDRLRTQLTRRGLAPDASLLPMLSFTVISLPEGFIDATVKAAMLVAARDAAEVGLVSTAAAAMTEGVLHTMFVTKLKTAAATLLAAGAIASGVGLYAYQGPAPAPPKVDQAPSAPGPHDGAVRLLQAVDMEAVRQLHAIDMEEFASKVQQLARHARQALAGGDIERAVRDLKEIESDASAWKDAWTARREGAKDVLPTPPTRASGAVPPLPGADQAVPRAGPAPGSLPASDGRRLDELERKVDRLIRVLEKDGREDTVVLQPAPSDVEGVVQKIDNQTKRVEINIGSDDGLIRGHVLDVYRRDRTRQSSREVYYLGRIRILGTNPDQAAAKVIELLEGKQIKEGDCVSARTPPIESDGAPSRTRRKE
jgi:RNA polymerase sigma factor (sigma-70 family)